MMSFKFCFVVVLICSFSVLDLKAQKHRLPSVDASGNIFDKYGKHIGRIVTDGMLRDSSGIKKASIDRRGCLVDTSVGLNQILPDNYSSRTQIFVQNTDQKWSVSEPIQGICKVKDRNGNTIIEVHKDFLQFTPCVYNCVKEKMR